MTWEKFPKLHLPIKNILRDVQGIFFDLDGVLYDAEKFKYISYVMVLLKKGIQLSDLNLNGLRDTYSSCCIGKSGDVNAENQLKKLREDGLALPQCLNGKEYRRERKEIYRLIEYLIPGIEGNINFVRKISENYPDCLLTIASRTDEERTRNFLKSQDLESRVEIAVVPGIESKYSVSARLAEKRGILLSSVVAVEDSREGVIQAHEFGLFTIAVPHDLTKKQEFDQADVVTSDLFSVFRFD